MFSICALFACAISSHAQSLVKGTVTDGIGEPLPGVSVVVKGTTNGTITDVNGKYSIQAINAGSRPIFLANSGRVQPMIFERVTVTINDRAITIASPEL